MSQILYINILVDWSLSGIMTSKLVIRESESPRPAASSILISGMTSSSVIIPYIIIFWAYYGDNHSGKVSLSESTRSENDKNNDIRPTLNAF